MLGKYNITFKAVDKGPFQPLIVVDQQEGKMVSPSIKERTLRGLAEKTCEYY